ncbi:sulfurtransferase TusA family protein [Pyrobaculum sp.]|uniref:sulfurtransferase TusA family protein n=1 Tax=Pyrobaculum sp. TaxID=2004705 RepID=UPI003D10D64B
METIDVSGQQCPDPLKTVASALANAPAGARYRIVTDDYVCYMMLRRLMALNDVKILEAEEGGPYVLVVEKS